MLILNANRHKHLEFFAILHVRSHYNTFAIFTKVKNIEYFPKYSCDISAQVGRSSRANATTYLQDSI
ncbi:hypothetical protein CJI53_04075 [Bifidobacteriaceae bacterium VN002]|nr:hypothetical protein CJI53_04075 [Bifidobacteriaceae bacterium VN002]